MSFARNFSTKLCVFAVFGAQLPRKRPPGPDPMCSLCCRKFTGLDAFVFLTTLCFSVYVGAFTESEWKTFNQRALTLCCC